MPQFTIEYEPNIDREGDLPVARVTFEASGYQRGYRGSYYEPPEPECFEDIGFVSAESTDPTNPLTEAEINACRAYIESDDGFWACNEIALDHRHAERDEMLEARLDELRVAHD